MRRRPRCGEGGDGQWSRPAAQWLDDPAGLPVLTRFCPDPEFDPPLDVAEPIRQLAPFVFNAPHSGSLYPRALLEASVLDARALRRSEDAFVDRLFAAVVPLGAPLMSARFPRAYLDVNREEYELDPRMFEGRLPARANTRSMRVAGGLGTVPRIVADGHEIYRGRLPVEEALRRIETLYRPYHRTLSRLLGRTSEAFGHAILIDCHSMPSGSLGRDEAKAEIVLGDRYGTSCSPALTDCVERALRARGFGVVRNKPYAGGFITEHYGTPALGRHALQIEINRAIYMDERAMTPLPVFGEVSGRLTAVFAEVMDGLDLGPRTVTIAAE